MVTPKPQTTATCQRPCSAPVKTAQATEPVPNSTIRKVPSASPISAGRRAFNGAYSGHKYRHPLMQLTKKARLPSRIASIGRWAALGSALPQGRGREQRLKLTLDRAEPLADHRVVDPAGIA